MMLNPISNYLNQIKKQLKIKKIAEELIEEFIENLEDQLHIMKEEIHRKEPSLSDVDQEIQVLTQCEPVDLVVKRVVHEFDGLILKVKREKEEVPSKGFLYPFRHLFSILKQYFEYYLIKLDSYYSKLKLAYDLKRNPFLTCLVYLALIILSLLIWTGIYTLLPPIYLVTTYPDNQTDIYLFKIPSSIWSDPTIESISIVPFSLIIYKFALIVITIAFLINLGWKNSSRYAFLSGSYIGVIISISWLISSNLTHIGYIKSRIVDPAKGWTFMSDWSYTSTPILNDFTIFILKSIFIFLICNFTFIYAMILLGGILKSLKGQQFIKIPMINKITTQLILQIFLLLICISTLYLIPLGKFDEYPASSPSSIPSIERPLVYTFEVPFTGGRNSSPSYVTTLHEFNFIAFYFIEFFNLTLSSYDQLPISLNGSLNPITGGIYDNESSTGSIGFFPLLGLLYLPNQFQNYTWRDLAATYLNDSKIFFGYNVFIDNELEKLTWWVNSSEKMLPVNTLIYISQINESKYTFSFDPSTGWLLKASLLKANEGTWVSGFSLPELTITRTFLFNTLLNPQPFYDINAMLKISFFIGFSAIFVISGLFYSSNTLKKLIKTKN